MARTLTPERKQLKKHAITLRKQGWTLARITEEIGIPDETLSRWFSQNGMPTIVGRRGNSSRNYALDNVGKFNSFLGKLEDFQTDIRFPLIVADPPWNISVENSMQFIFKDKNGQKHTPMVRNFGSWDFQGNDEQYLLKIEIWFKKLYEEEVEKKVGAGLNQEFNARVETAAITRAEQRLNELTATEWPIWYRASVEPKIIELESKINTGALQLLIGPWLFTCDRCGTSSNAELTAGEIEQLLRTGQIKVACANLDCEDHFLFSTQRHTFQVLLRSLIETRITGY